MSSPVIQPCRYKTGKTLGAGKRSVVKEVVHIDTGRYYAAKVISKRLMAGREFMVRNEIAVLKKVSMGHRNIVTLVDYFETMENLYLVTDLALGGMLFDRICRKGAYYEPDAASIILVTLSAVAYLHDHGIVHCNIQPENLLFRTLEDNADILVTGFGLSRILDEEQFPVLTTVIETTEIGTPGYMAPEVYKKTGHGKPIDLWAIGVVAYFMLCGFTPFDRDSGHEELQAILTADYSFTPVEYWREVSEPARDFINRCLTIDPAKRMTANQALSHPFLLGSDAVLASHAVELPMIRKNFNARRTLHAAIEVVRAINILRNSALERKKKGPINPEANAAKLDPYLEASGTMIEKPKDRIAEAAHSKEISIGFQSEANAGIMNGSEKHSKADDDALLPPAGDQEFENFISHGGVKLVVETKPDFERTGCSELDLPAPDSLYRPPAIASRDAPVPRRRESEDGTMTITTTYQASSFQERYSMAESTLPTTVSGNIDESNKQDEDAKTIITDDESLALAADVTDKLIAAFAKEISQRTESLFDVQNDSVDLILDALPQLLKEFSQELSATAQPGTQKLATIFVRHYRRRIASTTSSFLKSITLTGFESENQSESSDQPPVEGDVGEKVEEKMARWIVEEPDDLFEDEPDKQPAHDYIGSDDESDTYEEENLIPTFDEARDFLVTSEAYKRLHTRIQTASLLTTRKGQTIQEIRDKILESLTPRSTETRNKSPVYKFHSATFQISWNPLAFLTEQFRDGAKQSINEVITLNGSSLDAQALTCGQYMQQVWPETGHETLEALQAALTQPEGSHKCNLSDGTQLQIQLSDEFVLVKTAGTILSLADVGEQFAWLGAACRESPYDCRLAYSTACIQEIKAAAPSFTISFRLEDLAPDERAQNGSCWHELFRNPVIAKGFPILARRYNERGLEIPLHMMARLGDAERATMFHDQLLIKGFSTMFVPTKRIHNSVLWHFLFNKDDLRISYVSAKEQCPILAAIDTVNYSCLTSTRTFLGWASSVFLHTGSNDNDYGAIRYTGSNLSTAGCALEKVTISGGKFITAAATFASGKKDSVLSLSTAGPYQKRIFAASQMSVVLYDTNERRGWLVDGANALMHLTRAQLSRRPYSDSHLLDLKTFPHTDPSESSCGANAALKALSAIAAINPVIFEDTPTFGLSASAEARWGVKDVVLDMWHILEQIQDYTNELNAPGMPIRLTTRDTLEGFGFADLITGETTIRPRVAFLKSSGRGWVDFTREIKAITLMARGFGELIRPAEDSNKLCTAWKNVPKDQDYLAARICHLLELCEKFGDTQAKPLELVQGLYWHQGGHLFEPCSPGICTPACDRIQVLLPKLSLGTKRHPAPFECNKGAVIFGRSSRISKWWPKNPKLEPMDEAACLAEDSRAISPTVSQPKSFKDSGLGTEYTITDEAGGSQSGESSRALADNLFLTVNSPRTTTSGGLEIPVSYQISRRNTSTNAYIVSQASKLSPGNKVPATQVSPNSTNSTTETSYEVSIPQIYAMSSKVTVPRQPQELQDQTQKTQHRDQGIPAGDNGQSSSTGAHRLAQGQVSIPIRNAKTGSSHRKFLPAKDDKIHFKTMKKIIDYFFEKPRDDI